PARRSHRGFPRGGKPLLHLFMPFRLPTRVVLEPGCLTRLPEIAAGYADRHAPRRLLLVTDRGLQATGLPERVRRALASRSLAVNLVDEIEPNPRTTTVDRWAEEARAAGVTLVVGLGGGSVLDAAKAIAMLVPNGGRCEEYEGKNRAGKPSLPFLAVPTTCGTGSEVTWVSVLTHQERLWKMSVKGDSMYPDWAFVDADLVKSLPPTFVSWTGLDALTHALEATTGRATNPASDALALRAITLLFRYLHRAVEDIAGDAEAREGVVQAATLAGMAFGNADVAAVHCLSETIGARWDTPHGLANAVLVAPVLRSHLPAIEARLAALEPALPGRPTGADDGERAERFLLSLEALVRALRIPRFADLGLPREEHPWIARRAAENGSNGSNPRPMAAAQYLEILTALDPP
ncbi:MAG TPA: iron-containing alcohol dehydrogenase, partial [Thermoanaerobaculia bacterium]|nr:iron-containing alcohol dehydrogenase [Thermoanaerobaculia bacterium]